MHPNVDIDALKRAISESLRKPNEGALVVGAKEETVHGKMEPVSVTEKKEDSTPAADVAHPVDAPHLPSRGSQEEGKKDLSSKIDVTMLRKAIGEIKKKSDKQTA